MSGFAYTEWERPKPIKDAYQRMRRWAERGPEKPEDQPVSEFARGKAMTRDEFASFLQGGGKINYGDARMDKQIVNGVRHEERKALRPIGAKKSYYFPGTKDLNRRSQDLIDIVVDVVTWWDPRNYMENNNREIRDILSKLRNLKHHIRPNMSTRERRHQHAIRLAHALINEGSAAAYCQETGLDPADASRMLARLYAREPGLREAIVRRSACATTITWQKRQQEKIFLYWVRRAKRRSDADLKGTFSDNSLVYNLDTTWDVVGDDWLCDYDAGSIRNIYSGRFKPCASVRDATALPGQEDRPSKPLNLHQPKAWHKEGLPLGFWDNLREPTPTVERYTLPTFYGIYDRYRAMSQGVKLKNGKRATWRIGRALPIFNWMARPLGYCPQERAPVLGIFAGWDRARIQLHADPDLEIDNIKTVHRAWKIRIVGAKRWQRVQQHAREMKWAKGPMCRPAHSGKVLTWAAPDIETSARASHVAQWEPLPGSRQGPQRLIQPYTRRNWDTWPTKDAECLQQTVKKTEVELLQKIDAGLPLYFVRKVTPE
jgi:hypothetical protein